MDIYLKNVSQRDGNPFLHYPELKSIWEPDLCQVAIEAVDENFELQGAHPDADLGKIFLICVKDNDKEKVIGITGYYPSKEDFSEFTLRWHGLLEEYRGSGYSEQIIKFLSNYIVNKYPNATNFIEFMPVRDSYAETEKYFRKIGFEKIGEPEEVDWSTSLWQSYSYPLKKKM